MEAYLVEEVYLEQPVAMTKNLFCQLPDWYKQEKMFKLNHLKLNQALLIFSELVIPYLEAKQEKYGSQQGNQKQENHQVEKKLYDQYTFQNMMKKKRRKKLWRTYSQLLMMNRIGMTMTLNQDKDMTIFDCIFYFYWVKILN